MGWRGSVGLAIVAVVDDVNVLDPHGFEAPPTEGPRPSAAGDRLAEASAIWSLFPSKPLGNAHPQGTAFFTKPAIGMRHGLPSSTRPAVRPFRPATQNRTFNQLQAVAPYPPCR
jgi:hypothetical protein